MGKIYLKNKELREEIMRCKEKGVLSDTAVRMLSLLIKKTSNKFSYKYPEDREDCNAFALMDCVLYWKGYDVSKSDNAFAYFTQIIINGFKKAWRKLGYHPSNGLPEKNRISLSNENIYNL